MENREIRAAWIARLMHDVGLVGYWRARGWPAQTTFINDAGVIELRFTYPFVASSCGSWISLPA
jgi:hypothetical protein